VFFPCVLRICARGDFFVVLKEDTR